MKKLFKYFNKQLHLWFYVYSVNRKEIEGAGRFEETAFARLQDKLREALVNETVEQDQFVVLDTRTWVPVRELQEKLLKAVGSNVPLTRLNLSDDDFDMLLDKLRQRTDVVIITNK
jgi:hypothetical protein